MIINLYIKNFCDIIYFFIYLKNTYLVSLVSYISFIFLNKIYNITNIYK